ncbi:Alpha/Beta hydrolase protein [Halenospora varia]|nr:Alpha/Beta hydrolase protein [Halenospora varia]
MKLSLVSLGSSLGLVLATPTVRSTKAATRNCEEYMIPVSVSSTVFIPSFEHFNDDFDVVDFVSYLARRDFQTALNPFSGTKNVTGTYTIGATICSPTKDTAKSKTLLLATHGLGYDRRYWDSGIQAANYSFVDFALERGYSVFFYDRLGTGSSSKVSGYDEAQASTQLAILQQLTSFLRSGQYTGTLGKPSKLVHVGHSFGSSLSNALIATTPQLSDAAILTGIAYNGTQFGTVLESFGLRIATGQAPGKWTGRDNGYLTWVDAPANAVAFYKGGSYDKEVLWYSEDNKQPIAIIEFLTLATLPAAALAFTGPTMVISGEFDWIVCGGNCVGVLDHPTKELFPNATDLQINVHPKAGHGFNFAYNATGAYTAMLDYLNKHNL